jgi:aryl-alcohol dehydrogenase-like predicted oxidoreductase
VGAVALGGASWSLTDPIDAPTAGRVVDAAITGGVTLIDTAHAYTTRDLDVHNEELIAAVLRGRGDRGSVVVATKGGHFRAGDEFPIDGRPATIRRHCEQSLQTLGVDCLDLYQLHWPDPKVPLAESMGAFADLQQEGKVRLVGLSNVRVHELEDARTVVEIASVQNCVPLGGHDDVLDRCDALDIAYLAHAPLGGSASAAGITHNRPALASIAEAHGVSPQQVAIAWHLARSPRTIPVVGARRPETISDSARAVELKLSAGELRALSADAG